MAEATNKNGTDQAAAAADRKVKKGDTVHVVKADGKHLDAEVTGVRDVKANLIDIKFRCGSDVEDTVITSSPLDAQGKKPDSWHFPEPEVEQPQA